MSYKQVSPIPIVEGGTNTRSFPFDHGVIVYEAGVQISVNPGLANHVLTSNGPLLPPSFQSNPADGIVTLAADVGSATGATVTIVGGSNLNTFAAASSLTVELVNSPSVSGSITAAAGLIATAGGITSAGTTTINTAAVDYNTSIGNNTGVSTLDLKGGTGGIGLTTASTGDILINSSDTVLIDSAGVLELNSSAGVISIGNDGVSQNINIGTGGVRTLTLGNNSSTNTVTIAAGSGGINVGSTDGTAHTVSIGNTTGSSALTLSSGTGAINIGIGIAKIITIGNNTGTTSIVLNVGSVGLSIPSFTTTGAVVVDNAGIITDATASTAGFVLTSTGAVTAPTFQAIPPSFTWNNVVGATQAMAVGNGYIGNDGATLVTMTLPAIAAVGQVVAAQGSGTGLITIAQNAGQTIHFNGVDSTLGATGSVSTTSRYDAITLICIVANTDWAVNTSVGTFNVA